MPSCCVPLCKSKHQKRELVELVNENKPPLSFHEIPANLKLRELWLKAISRKDWTPNTNSSSSLVCSRHFNEDDFIIGGKYKRLKPNTVPSVFEGYPSYMVPPRKKPRLSSHISKRAKTKHSSTSLEATTSNLFKPVTIECELEVPDVTVDLESPRGQDACVQADITQQVKMKELNQWKRRYNLALKKMENLQTKLTASEEKLQMLKSDKNVNMFLKVVEAAEENQVAAIFILDQVNNFSKKKPSWSEATIRHSIMLRHISTRAYNHIRTTSLLKLPARSTLQKYLGPTSYDTGVTPLVKERLKFELRNLPCDQAKMCSLIPDEMKIQERLTYCKQADQFLGEVALEEQPANDVPVKRTRQVQLAKQLLCFILHGLSVPFRIPVAYYFTRDLQAEEFYPIVISVIRQVEEIGFKVVRLVTDNHTVNTATMKKLCASKELQHSIPHPCDETRPLFLSFDYAHIIKNIRSQFLDNRIGPNIDSSLLKHLANLQKNMLIKPVRFLTRKHVQPTNIEKMNVRRAVQVFSAPVTAALSYLQDQSGHLSDSIFKDAKSTVEFMENAFRWFTLHDTSNCLQHIQQKFPESRHYDSPDDARLDWIEGEFLDYLEGIKESCTAKDQFLSNDTYEAIILTSKSTAACVRYLLRECSFKFVLTRRFSSDSVEGLFSSLRQAGGTHDQLDVRAVHSGLRKILQTGIIASSGYSNVGMQIDVPTAPMEVLCQPEPTSPPTFVPPPRVLKILDELRTCSSNEALIPNLQNVSVGMVGGYLVRVVSENIDCNSCLDLIQSPRSIAPIHRLILYQDRDEELFYPKTCFLCILAILSNYADKLLPIIPPKCNVLRFVKDHVSKILVTCPALLCSAEGAEQHRVILCDLIIEKFFRPILTNYALNITDKHDRGRSLVHKPLSRKYLRM